MSRLDWIPGVIACQNRFSRPWNHFAKNRFTLNSEFWEKNCIGWSCNLYEGKWRDLFEFSLDVPTCKHQSESLLGAMKHETVHVLCEMSADPPVVEFSWTFNRSGVEVNRIAQSLHTDSGTTSTLHYTPINDMEYGTLACYGSNAVGRGATGPCYFQLVSAGRRKLF
jgi:hypothetical protein